MRNLSLCLTLLLSLSLNAQDPEIEKLNRENNVFYAESIYFVAVDSNNVILTEKPWGNKVIVLNDKFFKSYQVIYTNSDGALEFMKFDYLKGSGSGKTYFSEGESKTEYLFFEEMKDNQLVYIFTRTKKVKGLILFFAVKNITKTKMW